MTCANTEPTHVADADDQSTVATKAVLFCPECDYQAPWNGAWCVRSGAEERAVHCPRCGTQIE